MSTPPSAPILQIKPRARYDYLHFYWKKPLSTGINNFQPDQISSLSLWIDGNDSSTMNIGVASPHYITQVRDKVHGVVFTPKNLQSGSFLMAQTHTQNNMQSIWFNNQFANNVYLEGTYSLRIVGSIFMVFTAREQFFQSWRAIFGTTSDNTPRFTYLNGRNNVMGPGITYNDFPGTPTTTIIPGKTYMFYYSWNGSRTSVGLWGYTPVIGRNPEIIQTTGNILRFGRDVKDCANTNLCETLIFNTELTRKERQNMEGYLAWKWGLVDLLPPDHPYKIINPSDGGPATLTGYTLSCATLPFISTFSPTTLHCYLPDPRLQLATDYDFSIIASNMHGDGPKAWFMTTQIGLLPANVYDVSGSVIAPSTVDMTWDFTYTYPEAITKWFIITATPSVRGFSTVLKSTHGSERTRAITGLDPQVYTICVQAENNVGYSYPQPRNTITIPVSVDIGSLYFDGSSYLQFDAQGLGSNRFSIDCFFYLTQNPTQENTIFGSNDTFSISILNATTISLNQTNEFTTQNIQSDTWYHLAIVRDLAGDTTVFLNGIRSSTGTINDTNSYSFSYIGSQAGSLNFNGNISEIRVQVFSNEYDPHASAIDIPLQPLTKTLNTKFIMFTPYSPYYLIESGPLYKTINNINNVTSSPLHW